MARLEKDARQAGRSDADVALRSGLRMAAVSMAIWLGACSGGGTSSDLSEQEFVAQMASVLCEQTQERCELNGIPFDQTECQRHYEMRLTPPAELALDYDAASARSCIAEVRARQSVWPFLYGSDYGYDGGSGREDAAAGVPEAPAQLAGRPVCWQVFRPTLAAGEACRSWIECLDEGRCVPAGPNLNPVCFISGTAVRASAGDPCGITCRRFWSGADCADANQFSFFASDGVCDADQDGLYCSASSGVCQAVAKLGEACGAVGGGLGGGGFGRGVSSHGRATQLDFRECAPDAICGLPEECRPEPRPSPSPSGSSVSQTEDPCVPVCEPAPALGEECDASLGCSLQQYCADVTCTSESCHGRCAAVGRSGDACDPSSFGSCEVDLYCSGVTRTCAPLGAEGEACAGDGECHYDLFCDDTRGACAPKKREGSPCSRSYECELSTTCTTASGGVSTPARTPGSICLAYVSPSECGSPETTPTPSPSSSPWPSPSPGGTT